MLQTSTTQCTVLLLSHQPSFTIRSTSRNWYGFSLLTHKPILLADKSTVRAYKPNLHANISTVRTYQPESLASKSTVPCFTYEPELLANKSTVPCFTYEPILLADISTVLSCRQSSICSQRSEA